jgi:hypothetical protein
MSGIIQECLPFMVLYTNYRTFGMCVLSYKYHSFYNVEFSSCCIYEMGRSPKNWRVKNKNFVSKEART